MAENKKSFLLYTDLHETVKILENEQAGKLFKHLLSYVNDENPETEDIIVKVAFEPIKQSLKRDLRRYEEIREKRREAGKKGGRPKAKKAKGYFKKQSKAKKPVSVNVSDSVINKYIPDPKDFKNYALLKQPNTDTKKLGLKYEAWKENGWRDGNNKPIKNWKVKLLNTLPYLQKQQGQEL